MEKTSHYIHLREHWEGVSLPGDYALEEWLGGDERAAFFQTSPASDGRRAVVKLVPGAGADGAALLDLWHRIRQLRHPNLVELLDYGRAERGGETVCYAVFESPDDTLAAALHRSPLNPQESREVLDSILNALRYLHAQGLALGALDPGHIVAVGDRIKLSTAALRAAAASSAYREDVRLLGGLWRHDLMSASPNSADIAAHASDPDPLARWTLAEISAALNPPLPTAPAVPAPPASQLPPSRGFSPEPAVSYRFPKWIFAAAAGALLLIVIVALLNRPRSAGVVVPIRVASVSPPAATPKPEAEAVTPQPAPAAREEKWRVIAFTYRNRNAAARQVQRLNRHYPGLHPTVFTPKDRSGYYLVSLGGRVTYEEAVRLQRVARSEGLPRDLYVQNYSE